MAVKAGSSDKGNLLKGAGSAVIGTATEIQNINQPLRQGVLLYNTTTKELKVADGTTPPSALADHLHPNTYAPIVHSHMKGANEPWLISNPRLWYLDDIANHPELVLLDGSEISNDRAEFLSAVYPGTKLLTNKLTTLDSSGSSNNEITLTVDQFSGVYLASNLCNDELDITNFAQVGDQWLTGNSDLNTGHTVTIAFKGNFSYRPTQYWVIPAAGVAESPLRARPTPQAWTFEGSNDGTNWDILDQHTDESADSWSPLTTRFFSLSTPNDYTHLRLVITKWNAGYDADMYTGLRRLWVFGRKKDVFTLPNLESPNPDFGWVVPYKNLNVGLNHEDIGDIGTTALLNEHLPSYRLQTDGSSVSANTYPLLFETIGHQYDQELPSEGTTVTASTGTISEGVWTSGISDATTASYIDINFSTPCMLGKYVLDIGDGCAPAAWIVEGKTADGTYETIQSFTNISTESFTATKGVFLIDTAVTEKNYVAFRINFISWNDETSATIGYTSLKLYVHEAGNFYLPNRSIADDVLTYIVADNAVVDVSADVIQRLQQNIIDMTSTIASLQAQVNNLDPDVES